MDMLAKAAKIDSNSGVLQAPSPVTYNSGKHVTVVKLNSEKSIEMQNQR